MITLLSATPGSGKSLLATEKLLDMSRDNIANLKHNYFYAKAFFEKIAFLKLESYLSQLLVTKGQGLERITEIVFFETDYFDFLKTEYYINVISNPDTDDIVNNYPEFYFERIVLLNLIIDDINSKENTKFQYFKPVRTIYTNIADLKLVQCRPLPPECDWRQTPQGSYFVIDEAQLIPIFSDEAKGIDPIVKDLTIHRHKGYDFLFITQEPSFVHKYIRKLASLHIHLVNIFGWEQSMRMEWSVVQDSPNAIKSIARAENVSRWRFPKHVYNLYKSTTINTRVKRVPKKLIIFVALAVICILTSIFMLFSNSSNPLISTFSGKPIAAQTQGTKKNEPTAKSTTESNAKQKSADEQKAASEVQAQNENPASTPVASPSLPVQPTYDPADPLAFQPVTTPSVVNSRIFSGCVCTKKACTAYDQQGTKIVGFDRKLCKQIIKDSSTRPFDYFNNRSQQQQTTEQDSSPAMKPENAVNQENVEKPITAVIS
ncbi:putative phage-like protein [Acinetobacter baumannii]|uniref:zonular occludens toxin domain-containing protein n=1 Tax=Acinetobacter baumannii TaxID=470 RepID=UPI000DE77707|nr:zonular occludens toxin domain-containing protein [Acinetobacter baumannii]SSP64936.1 putative phage-like protein [Acinetobacter baumannii]